MNKSKMHCIIEFEDGQETIAIKANEHGQGSLTELWQRAGKPVGKRPSEWLRLQEVVEFVEHLKGENPHLLVPIQTKPGRNGGTYGEIQLCLKYAQYLSPEFQREVNDVFIQRMEEIADPELGMQRARQRAVETYRRQGRSTRWISSRLQGIDDRSDFTDALASAGVKGWGYATCTNAIYKPLLGGDAKQLKTALGLKEKENIRDNLGLHSLTDVMFAERLAGGMVEDHKITGNFWRDNKVAEQKCDHAARLTVNALKSAGVYDPVIPRLT